MKNEEDKVQPYQPTDKESETIKMVYDEFIDMSKVMTDSYPEFNDRTLVSFLNDNQKRANSYVPSKESQGKDDWQANIFTPTTRNKVKTLIAGIAKEPPPMSITAVNEKNQVSIQRAELMEGLILASYVQGDNNPEKVIFFDGWNCAINGTVIKYDGYLKVTSTVKLITDYELETGTVKFEESEETVEDQAIEMDVPVQNLYIKNPNIREVQEQPALIWLDYYDKERFDYEFSGHKNHKYVKGAASMTGEGENQLFFGDMWKQRTNTIDRLYEVLRYYCKSKDCYIIVVNGVVLLDSPMLWGRRKKRYPFAKEIFEPFANSNLFWGNSLPNILMAEQDVENALVNSMTDKTFRSMVPPMLIGLANKDAFDLEDEYVNTDSKIYVDDVSQVTPMPIPQVNASEIQMLKIIQGGLDKDSTDQIQGGATGSGSTAREVVIANERADQLKGLFFLMMKDLWLQKYRLRSINILMNYSQAKVKEIAGEDGAKLFEEQFKTFDIPNTELSSGTMGNLNVEVVKDRTQLQSPAELSVREHMMLIQGRPTEIVQITSDYLDNYEYVIKIETQDLYHKSKATMMAQTQEMIGVVAKLFPDIFLANKEKFFKKLITGYGDSPEQYLEGMNMQQPSFMPPMGGQQQQQLMQQPAQQMNRAAQPLPQLAGVA